MRRLYGEFLVDKGVISVECFLEALNLQMKNRPPIGQVALEERMITSNELFVILSAMRKVENSHKHFGEVACSLGILTQEQVNILLDIQNKNCKPIGEILVTMGRVSRETQISLLREFYAEK